MQRLPQQLHKSGVRCYRVASVAYAPSPVTTLNTKQTEYKPNARLLGNLDGFASALNRMDAHTNKAQGHGLEPRSWDDAPRKTYTPRATWRPSATENNSREPSQGEGDSGGPHPFLRRPQRNVLSFGKPSPREDQPQRQYPSESGPREPRRSMDGPGRGADSSRAPDAQGGPPRRVFRQPSPQVPTWASRSPSTTNKSSAGRPKRPRRARKSSDLEDDLLSSRSSNPLADLSAEEAKDMDSISNFAFDGNGSSNAPYSPEFAVTEVGELGKLGGARVLGGSASRVGLSPGEKAGDYSRFGVKAVKEEGEAVGMARFVLAKKKDTGVDARKTLLDLIRSSTAVPKASPQLLEQAQGKEQQAKKATA